MPLSSRDERWLKKSSCSAGEKSKVSFGQVGGTLEGERKKAQRGESAERENRKWPPFVSPRREGKYRDEGRQS